jgi:hypothetical protein
MSSPNFAKLQIPFRDNKLGTKKTLYFHKSDSTDCFFQIRFFRLQNLNIDSREILRVMLDNKNIDQSIFTHEFASNQTYDFGYMLTKINLKPDNLGNEQSILEELHYIKPIRKFYEQTFSKQEAELL